MNITRENYEAYLLDLMENRLSSQEEEVLLNFLEQNTDLEDVIPDNVTLYPEPLDAFSKEGLNFQKLTPATRKHFFIASIEGQLGAQQKEELKTFLKEHPNYQKEYESFSKTVFIPNQAINYENKKQLHAIAKTPIVPFYYYTNKIAASVLLLIGLGAALWFFKAETSEESMYVQTSQQLDLTIDEYIEATTQASVEESSDENGEKGMALKKNKKINKLAPTTYSNEVIELKELKNIEHQLTAKVTFQRGVGFEKIDELIPFNIEKDNDLVQEDIEPIEEAIERLTIWELLVSNLNDKVGFMNNSIFGGQVLTDKITALFGEDNYVEKKEGKQVKTQLSFGKFKFERIKSQ